MLPGSRERNPVLVCTKGGRTRGARGAEAHLKYKVEGLSPPKLYGVKNHAPHAYSHSQDNLK